MSELDDLLLAAHTAADNPALVSLYEQAADMARGQDAESFYLTHAYVFALETGHPHAPALHQRLKALGCEE